MIASKRKTNYLSNPMGIDPGVVILTWISAEGIRQSAFRITLAYDGQICKVATGVHQFRTKA